MVTCGEPCTFSIGVFAYRSSGLYYGVPFFAHGVLECECCGGCSGVRMVE